ncbi:hypothetical protein [Falsiroseomonas sp.]|uniref:hypothetical protein n=1 Tax=Falsiroseomonas sp. TaxID=2870721 RepID=UPI003F708D41
MVAHRAQLTLGFDPVEPVEPRQVPRWGFWTLNVASDAGRLQQRIYRLDQLPFVLAHCRRDRDTYMSQGLFARPTRRAIHLLAATHAQVDLDTYNVDRLRSLTADQLGGLVRLYCRDEGIPQPSAIISSGRGLYLKWYWQHAIPRAAAGRAVAVNRALAARFNELGADPRAIDMSRILRVIGTVNSKSGEVVRLLHLEQSPSADVLTYDFDCFADDVLPHTLEQIRGYRDAAQARKTELRIRSHEKVRRAAAQQARGVQRVFCREDWHWGVLEDIRTIVEKRWPKGVPEGWRDTIGHLGACQLGMVVPEHVLWPEIQAWARILLPTDYVSNDLAGHASSLLDRARRAANGERTIVAGRERSPIWTYSKTRLIEMLQVEPAEERILTRLITDDEKRRRDREATTAARRAAGVQERTVYEARAAHRRRRVVELRAVGRSWRAIGAELGISHGEAQRLAKTA